MRIWEIWYMNNLHIKIDLNHRKRRFTIILLKSDIKNRFFSSHYHTIWSFFTFFDHFLPFLNRFWSILIDFDWFWSILIDLCTLKINKNVLSWQRRTQCVFGQKPKIQYFSIFNQLVITLNTHRLPPHVIPHFSSKIPVRQK